MTREHIDLKDNEEVFILFILFDMFIAGSLMVAGIFTIAYSFHADENIAVRAFVFAGGMIGWAIGRMIWHEAIKDLKKK